LLDGIDELGRSAERRLEYGTRAAGQAIACARRELRSHSGDTDDVIAVR
jgi:hypothetical protein